MPIHDWTRVRANRFHHFHQTWTIQLAAALNAGRLPPGYFALAEQRASGPEPDVIALELTPSMSPTSGGLTVTLQPPKTRFCRSRNSVSGVGGGGAVPLNSGTVSRCSFPTTRLMRSRPWRILYCVW